MPLDYSNPTGDTIKIAIIRKPATDLPARIGSLLITLGDQRAWSILDSALSAADQGNGPLLLTLADVFNGRQADGSYKSFLEASTAISCLDNPVPTDVASSNQVGTAMANALPFFVSEYFVCSHWPIKPKGSVGSLSANGAAPILLVGGTGDYPSPYAWAQGVNRQLTGSVLLTRKGYGHISYDKSECVKQAVDAYLINLTLPAPGTVCESDLP